MTTVNTTPRKPAASQFVSGLKDAVRDNPIAAGLIGLGAVWFFVGGSRMAALGGVMAGATGSAGGAVGSGISSVTRAVGDQVATASEAAVDAARSLKDGIVAGAQGSNTAVRATAKPGDNAVADAGSGTFSSEHGAADLAKLTAHGTELFGSVQKSLTKTLERQPLVLGGIGLAIGAGIASAFALTQTESELIGNAGAKVRGSVESLAAETAETARNVAGDAFKAMKEEAKQQGFTASDLQNNLQDVGERLKSVAGATRASVKRRL